MAHAGDDIDGGDQRFCIVASPATSTLLLLSEPGGSKRKPAAGPNPRGRRLGLRGEGQCSGGLFLGGTDRLGLLWSSFLGMRVAAERRAGGDAVVQAGRR